MEEAKKNIAYELSKILDMAEENVLTLLEKPKDEKMGDIAFPCFRLAAVYKKSPQEIALNLKEKLEVASIQGVGQVEVAGGYLNFYLDNQKIIGTILNDILEQKEKYYCSNIGENQTVCVDYSSPNIAKPFHIGHLRSTVIGAAICKIYKHLGYNVVGINHLGDFGTQFGYVIEGYKRWGKDYDLSTEPIKKLVELYIKINELAKEDESVVEKARENFLKLENGDEEIVALWSKFRELSLDEYKKIYKRLGVHFDSYNGEAFYNDKMQEIVDILSDKNVLVESEGAKVVELEKENIPCMILKTNGSTTYATRDLAAILYRAREYDFDKCLYLTGYEQNLHFKQIFEVSKHIVPDKTLGLIHVPFGMVLGPGGKKMSTRKGASATIEDVIDEVIGKAKEILISKNKVSEELLNDTADKIGIGAVIFNDLKNSRIKDEIFDMDEMLKFEGETGPYIQYTYVRTASILEKAGYTPNVQDIDTTLITTKEEISLVKMLARAKEVLKQAASLNEPSVVTRYIIDVASAFSKYYNECQIIVDDEKVKRARLCIVYATGIIIKEGLNILGISCPDKM